MLCFQVVDVSDPPVREAGTVQADVDELVGPFNTWLDTYECYPGVQVEGEGLLHQLDTCLTTTFGPSFILGQPWVIKNQDLFLTKHSS